MLEQLLPYILSFAGVVIFLLIFLLLRINKLNNQNCSEIESIQRLFNELQINISMERNSEIEKRQQTLDTIMEVEQVNKQLEHRIKLLQEDNKKLYSIITQIQQQQPEDKLYSRASKLVSLGADVNEIMKECDIPKAEAEMLLSIHKKNH